MANYIFESTTQAQASAFTADDYLIFISSGTNAQTVTVTPVAAPAGSTAPSNTDFGVTIAAGAQSLNFRSAPLSEASQANHLIFNDSNSHLLIGGAGSDADLTSDSTAATTGAGAKAATTTVVYGLAGADNITGGDGNDYLYGGFGGDTITAGEGNNHIYGNSLTTTQGSNDGADIINVTAGSGSNYVNGNAGADQITVGNAESTGYNRVFGGADADTITLNGTIGSIAAVNGNLGNDTIIDNSDGSNTLRGGQGNDEIRTTGKSHDVILGDLGNDTIIVSGSQDHVVLATGGAGADRFDFSKEGAGVSATLDAKGGPDADGTTYYQEITDFTVGTGGDKIVLGTAVADADAVGHSATVFANVDDAQIYAQTQLGGDVVVSSLSVGTSSSNSTYLFYNDVGSADGIIHLDGVSSASITNTAFAVNAAT